MQLKAPSIALILGLVVVIAVAWLSWPRVQALPNNVAAKEILIEGKRYILITGTNTDPSSQLSVIRQIRPNTGDAKEGVLVLDRVSAPLVVGIRSPVVVRFPQLIDLGRLPDGPWTVKAKSQAGLREIYRFQVGGR